MPIWLTPDPNVTDVVVLLVTIILPIFVALVGKSTLSGAARGWLLALFAALLGFGQHWIDNPDGFDLWKAIVTTVGTFAVAVAAHFGLWRAETSSGGSVSGKAKAAIW